MTSHLQKTQLEDQPTGPTSSGSVGPRSEATLTADPARPATPGGGPLPTVPGYTLTGVIAKGGMGIVYHGTQLGLNRPAAVKLMHGWARDNATALVRFTIEAEAVARLRHPHVVGVYEFGEYDGSPFLAMEFLDGGTLEERIRRHGRFPPAEAAGLVAVLADAVSAAHAQGVVHRDLKPSNVMFTAAGVPKITDFGLARIGGGEVTVSGVMLGTPRYMSPEQAEGRVRETGTATDVWALGCILYRVLTGRLPFDAASDPATIQQVIHSEPLAPRRLTPDVPRDLETICLKCLEKEPQRRYATADALAADLRAYLDGRPIAARPVSLAERGWKWAKRHPARAAVAAATVVLLAAAAVTVVQVGEAMRAERERGERVARATAAAEVIAAAETAAVPSLIDGLGDLRDLTRPRLHEFATLPVGTKAGLHARFALLPDEPGRADELLAHALTCPADELALFARLAPFAADATPDLWATVEAGSGKADRVLRAAALLAAWDPTDRRWGAVSAAVVDRLIRVSRLEVEAYARVLRPVAPLTTELRRRYLDSRERIESGKLLEAELLEEFGRFELTATLLAAWVADRPDELAELVVTFTDRHYPLLADATAAHRDELVPMLKAELARRPHQDWAAVEGGRVPVDEAVAAVVGPALERGVTIPDSVVEAAARRQAYAAALLFAFGHPGEPEPLLTHSPDPSVRGHLIARLATVGAEPAALVGRYDTLPDLSARRAVLIALGEFPPDRLAAAARGPFVDSLLADYAAHDDPGLHSLIGWLLRERWGGAAAVAAVDARLQAEAERRAKGPPGRRWFVNTQGQTYAVVSAPQALRHGSPVHEADRLPAREPARGVQLEHTFAVATKEVTRAEFLRFNPKLEKNPYNEDPDAPAVIVSWYAAAAYCNWLSARDDIPEDQWCYVPNDKGEYALGMTVRENRFALQGYRLPTEAEWECATRAGSRTARFFGLGHALLDRYGWFERNAKRKAKRGGGLRPNEWGLFDTLGNVWEWCEEAAVLDEVGRVVGDDPDTPAAHRRVYRGGSFFDDIATLRAANRNSLRPGDGYYSVGFRPVRSFP
jgi:formylglycine-generating enzyme required for sulfatase activity